MRYQCALIAVRDVKKSLAFYQKWFNLEVEVDLGWNIGLKGGLSLQEHFTELLGLPDESAIEKSHNMELYFDCDDLDSLNQALLQDVTIEWVTPIKECPWKQRVLRIYDPDHHIIEVGERMTNVFIRLIQQGYAVDEVANLTGHPLDYVRVALEGGL